MKTAIAAFFLAAAFLTSAQATTVLMTTTLSTGSSGDPLAIQLSPSGGYVYAAGFQNMFPVVNGVNTTTPAPSGATDKSVLVATDQGGQPGIGLSLDNGYIPPTDAVVLDFSHVTNPITSISFTLWEDVTGPATYEVYGTNATLNTSTGAFVAGNGGTTYSSIASGSPITKGSSVTISTSALTNVDSLIIGLTGDCAIDIRTITLNSPVPEPGTFVMAGMALLALGVTLKKRGKKV